MDEKKDVKLIFAYWGIFVLTGALVFAFSYFSGKSYELILRNSIVSMSCTGTVIFLHSDAISKGFEGLSYDNYDHRFRFIAVYAVSILLACAFSFVPDQFWPYMALFVILSLFSNTQTEIVSGISLVTISVLLEQNGSYSEFLMYVIAGAVAVILFRDLKENTNIRIPMAISLLVQTVLLMGFHILFLNRTLSFAMFVLPVINIMLNLVILLIVLNVFGLYVIRKSNDRYMEINDTTFSLLTRLKDEKKEEYYRAIHTAYLAERIAIGLGLNVRAVKNCSYYHKIGLLEGKTTWEDVKHFYEDEHFPDEAVKFLHEYIEPQKGAERSTESLAVNVSETLISAIMDIFEKNKNTEVDYNKLIDSVLDKKIADKEILNYSVSYRQYDQMRKILKKENLYYDFLR